MIPLLFGFGLAIIVWGVVTLLWARGKKDEDVVLMYKRGFVFPASIRFARIEAKILILAGLIISTVFWLIPE